MSIGILAVGFADGTPCPHAGMWLKSFDHDVGKGLGVFSPYPENALRFDSAADAMEFWRRQSTTQPYRPDGKPNRPLTALTVSIEPIDESR